MEQVKKKLATESFVYKTVGDASEAILKGMELMFEKQEKKLMDHMDSIENSLSKRIDQWAEIVTAPKLITSEDFSDLRIRPVFLH